ncbi:MAG TPA: tryptophan synthase subunit alpha [Chitinophagaceae bacterium]|nr:tryptophan synthase subunit alpha [Chitinophagaceae bacterium]
MEKRSRISEVFARHAKAGGKPVLNVYCTAGFPQPGSTIQVMQALQDAGADLIELGMPYSDPLADGPVIQHSSAVALAGGMTIARLLEQLRAFRQAQGGAGIPVILMGYMNPVLQYGFEQFCRDAAEAGADGLILPDLPEFEFESEYGAIIRQYGLDFIFLVTPETSEQRVRRLDQLSSGFLYAVSSSSTTGKDKEMGEVTAYLQRLRSMGLRNPVLVGFGIKDRASFRAACSQADGAIIGSAYIRMLEQATDITAATKAFLHDIQGD